MMMERISRFLLNERKQDKIVPFLSILLGFLIGAIILAVFSFSPALAYGKLVQGAFGGVKRFGNTLLAMTPLILTGLSVGFAFKTGLFNIGASGQMLMGGFFGTYIGVVVQLPKIIHLPFAVITAVLFGALWAAIPGILKARLNIHEVVTTIMMNWIAVWSVNYFVPELIPGHYDTESAVIASSASLRVEWMSALFAKSYVNLGLFLALGAAVIIWIVLEKTTFGYELKAVGYNQHAAQYAGIKVKRNIVLSMMISGALAGLAGATYYLGYTTNMKIGELPSLGFDGIAVALLGLNSPVGIVLAGGLFGMMNAGKGFMQTATDVPNELVPIIMGMIIFFAATNQLIKIWIKKIGRLLSHKSEKKKNGGEK